MLYMSCLVILLGLLKLAGFSGMSCQGARLPRAMTYDDAYILSVVYYEPHYYYLRKFGNGSARAKQGFLPLLSFGSPLEILWY